MDLIKLTDEKGQTYGNTQWGKNVTHEVEWSGNFCSRGCIHVYQDLHVALLLNPIHANFSNPRAWKAKGKVLASDRGLKFGTAKLTTISEIFPVPKISLKQYITFGILCAKQVYQDHGWIIWADNWLKNTDRSSTAAHAAYNAASAAASAAAILDFSKLAEQAMNWPTE